MKLLKKLYRISSPSNNEQAMQSFIISLLKGSKIAYTQDRKGNIYATKGESDSYPCVVCHIDEVHKARTEGYKVVETDGVIYGFNSEKMSFEGIGADDKNGIWVCIKALNEFDIIKCAFFVAEEVGCKGSNEADMTFFEDCRFVLQCDRKGNSDFITDASGTELCSNEFVSDANISAFGYKKANGMMTDVMTLKGKGLKVSSCNISCGYYNPHTNNEMTRISDLLRCYELVKHIIETCTKVYPHEYVKLVYTSRYGCYNDDWDSYWKDDNLSRTTKPIETKNSIVEGLLVKFYNAWRYKNGTYVVYDNESNRVRPASESELRYAKNIQNYMRLYDYYDDIEFDENDNPLVKIHGEREYYKPDPSILRELYGEDDDEYTAEYDEMCSWMADESLNDPENFKLDEFKTDYSEYFPHLSDFDYSRACEEIVGCTY